MTIWFSTNIPEMRAISTFNRVSTDIGEIQQRIATGQRINSGKDDPGGLMIRETLRAEIKNVQSLQLGMLHADAALDFASGALVQLLEILRGPDIKDPSGGLIGELGNGTDYVAIKAAATKVMQLYDATVARSRYDGDPVLEGFTATYQLGGGKTLTATVSDWSTAAGTSPDPDGGAFALAEAVKAIATEGTRQAALDAADDLLKAITKESGDLGSTQRVVSQNQKLLDSRLTNVMGAEGKISNADIANESSRLARSELLAQNAMNSIMYSRSYAAFAVTSLFR
jgi:flagellin